MKFVRNHHRSMQNNGDAEGMIKEIINTQEKNKKRNINNNL